MGPGLEVHLDTWKYNFCVIVNFGKFSVYVWYTSEMCAAFDVVKAKRIKYKLEWNLPEKKCKMAIVLYCFHTAGVLLIFVLFNLLDPWTSFYRKSKINIKRKPNYDIGWFHHWPMIISYRLYAFHFTNDNFLYKSNAIPYSPNSFFKVYLTALKNSKLKWIV